MTDSLDPYDLPEPTSDRAVAERRYKRLIGIVRGNEPVDETHINIVFARRYDTRKLGPLLGQAVRNGHLQRDDDGRYLTTDAVR